MKDMADKRYGDYYYRSGTGMMDVTPEDVAEMATEPSCPKCGSTKIRVTPDNNFRCDSCKRSF